jgi:hypothetical protein
MVTFSPAGRRLTTAAGLGLTAAAGRRLTAAAGLGLTTGLRRRNRS